MVEWIRIYVTVRYIQLVGSPFKDLLHEFMCAFGRSIDQRYADVILTKPPYRICRPNRLNEEIRYAAYVTHFSVRIVDAKDHHREPSTSAV